ncbi:MAG: hypothetical protein Kow00114_15800 [Kiloniellaceae bacterium]
MPSIAARSAAARRTAGARSMQRPAGMASQASNPRPLPATCASLTIQPSPIALFPSHLACRGMVA